MLAYTKTYAQQPEVKPGNTASLTSANLWTSNHLTFHVMTSLVQALIHPEKPGENTYIE